MMDPATKLAWYGLCEKWGNAGYDSLTKNEKTWLNIRALIDSVENGGLISYFYNSGADNLLDLLAILQELECDETREHILTACELFPGEVPKTMDARNEVINSWPNHGKEAQRIEAVWDDLDDKMMPLMEDLDEVLDAFIERESLV